MKVLLINNGTKRIKQLQNLLKEFEVDTLGLSKLNGKIFNGYDFIVLSGGNRETAFTTRGTYNAALDLIKKSEIPIFGVCLGMQLIVHVYSPVIFKRLEPRRRGVLKIKHKDQLLKVFTSHKWAIPKVNSPLINIANSKDGIEIIKHKTKLIWGVQFHPEADAEFGTNGRLIFDEFIAMIQNQNDS